MLNECPFILLPSITLVHYIIDRVMTLKDRTEIGTIYRSMAARPATARAPNPASVRPAAPVTWTGPLLVADGAIGVLVGATVGAVVGAAALGVGGEAGTGVTVTTGMVTVPGVGTG